jgi:DNA-binding transcriptional regulator YdaS (Cro superfamily)
MSIQRMPGWNLMVASMPAIPTPSPSRPEATKRPVNQARNRPDVVELASIKDQLGLTNESMAKSLKILNTTLSSYIYGQTTVIPDRVLTAARVLRDRFYRENPSAIEAAKILADGGLSDFVADQAMVLGIQDKKLLAAKMGISYATILRWMAPGSSTRAAQLAAAIAHLEKTK